MIHQNGFTRTTLSTTVSKFVEENQFLFTHRQDSRCAGRDPLPGTELAIENAFNMFKAFE